MHCHSEKQLALALFSSSLYFSASLFVEGRIDPSQEPLERLPAHFGQVNKYSIALAHTNHRSSSIILSHLTRNQK
jgi:hypothetical protein